MACEGAKPVVAIYSTFLQRAYDQLIHDVALQDLDVTFAIDRGGLVGPDGPTHAGSFDLSYLRCIPNMVVMAPADEDECRKMLTTGFQPRGPAAVRYPRGSGTGVAGAEGTDDAADRQGRSAPRAATASRCSRSARWSRRARASPTRSMRRSSTCASSSRSTRRSLLELARDALRVRHDRGQRDRRRRRQRRRRMLRSARARVAAAAAGLADGFLDHGSREELLAQAGLDATSIESAIRARFGTFSPRRACATSADRAKKKPPAMIAGGWLLPTSDRRPGGTAFAPSSRCILRRSVPACWPGTRGAHARLVESAAPAFEVAP